MTADDWAVVEEALNHYGTWRMQKPRRERAKVAIARLREREAQLERELSTLKILDRNERADRAEARVFELGEEISAYASKMRAAEYCVARLEEALREMAERGVCGDDREYARRALAHEEEA